MPCDTSSSRLVRVRVRVGVGVWIGGRVGIEVRVRVRVGVSVRARVRVRFRVGVAPRGDELVERGLDLRLPRSHLVPPLDPLVVLVRGKG